MYIMNIRSALQEWKSQTPSRIRCQAKWCVSYEEGTTVHKYGLKKLQSSGHVGTEN
jgi:hypothetical protein